MKTWLEPSLITVPDALRDYVGGHHLIAQTLARRGVVSVAAAQAFLDPAYYRPASPYDLPDMDKAVERLRRAIKAREVIAVWGDFDVDGQTSAALLVSALSDLGAEVRYHIPNRMTDGHGVHIPRLRELIDAGAGLILTCDTGIAAHEAVTYAHSRGVDVVITDHHQLPATLPDAYAAVNPQRLDEGHPLRTLPGVGAAYKLVEALYDGRDTSHLLDLVALGIVADVAAVTGDTRYLLQAGLTTLRETSRPGLQAMIELAGINPAELSEQHIGFDLAPRLNALGRLADANPAVTLLTTRDTETARVLAVQLEGLNNERKLQSSQVSGGAQALIEKDPSLLDYAALVLSHTDWPGGVVGIVANQLVAQYNRPVILITAPEGEPGRGSARSVAGCDITAAIAAHEHLLLGYGGHTMAAGLTIAPENIAEFRRALSRTVQAMLGDVPPVPALTIDGYLPLDALSLELVRDVERLAPFGPGNPPLVLATTGLRINRYATVGRRGEHLSVTVEDETGITHKVLWWRADEDDLPPENTRFDLAYTVRANTYRGAAQVQVEWVDTRPVADGMIEPEREAAEIEASDFRLVSDPQAILRDLEAEEAGLQVWREATKSVAGQVRHELTQAAALAVWTIPPGSREWRETLARVRPARVYLFGIAPGLDALEPFITRLGGLVKHAINAKGGTTRLDQLAAAMAHRESTVRAGLDWMAAQGAVRVVSAAKGEITLAQGGEKSEADLHQAEAQLVALLAETRAYRAYWREAAGYNLVRKA